MLVTDHGAVDDCAPPTAERAAGELRKFGLLALTAGDIDAAPTQFDDPYAFTRDASFPPEHTWCCCDNPDALLARGADKDLERTQPLLVERRSVARELGMKRWRRMSPQVWGSSRRSDGRAACCAGPWSSAYRAPSVRLPAANLRRTFPKWSKAVSTEAWSSKAILLSVLPPCLRSETESLSTIHPRGSLGTS